jgi:hypothetical protein
MRDTREDEGADTYGYSSRERFIIIEEIGKMHDLSFGAAVDLIDRLFDGCIFPAGNDSRRKSRGREPIPPALLGRLICRVGHRPGLDEGERRRLMAKLALHDSGHKRERFPVLHPFGHTGKAISDLFMRCWVLLSGLSGTGGSPPGAGPGPAAGRGTRCRDRSPGKRRAGDPFCTTRPLSDGEQGTAAFGIPGDEMTPGDPYWDIVAEQLSRILGEDDPFDTSANRWPRASGTRESHEENRKHDTPGV